MIKKLRLMVTKQINALKFDGGNDSLRYDKEPDECPFCHKSITPRRYQGFEKNGFLEIVFRCPDFKCGRLFLSRYKEELVGSTWIYMYKSSSIGRSKERDFSDNIKNLSNSFVEIYNQAAISESLNLEHIAGTGYRKALEFLIKDYLISKNPDNEKNIKKKFLGKCIKEDIGNVNLKKMAERATWLGNDETHYVRKWKDKDIGDLKKLIDLSLRQIEMELSIEQYKSEMS